jgi:hypothetical protein
LPILAFLVLVASMLILFAIGQPVQTLIGVAVVLVGVPVSWAVVPARAFTASGR